MEGFPFLMTQYFDFSQQLKKEIEEHEAFMQIIDRHMSGDHAEWLNGGNMNTIFRVGQIESGLWLAIRQQRGAEDYGISRDCMNLYETYARKAEEYSKRGRLVVKFCVGVVKELSTALLVEDLTNGGTRILEPPMWGEEYGFYHGSKERVYVDLDNEKQTFAEFKYMHQNNMIKI